MSTSVIFMFAMGVFALMAIGIGLTMVEFNKLTDEPSLRKDSEMRKEPRDDVRETPRRARQGEANIRVVH